MYPATIVLLKKKIVNKFYNCQTTIFLFHIFPIKSPLKCMQYRLASKITSSIKERRIKIVKRGFNR